MQNEPAAYQEPTSRQELIEQIHAECAALVELIESIPPEERETPLVDELSVKDLLAHITDWQEYMLRRLRATALGETFPLRVPDGNYDRVNAEIYQTHLRRPWDDIWQDFERIYEETIAEIEQLSEEDLFDPQRAEAVTGIPNHRAVDMIVGNTSGHYWEHRLEIESRRAQR